MRLGGPILSPYSSPAEWLALVRAEGYGAVYAPIEPDSSDDVVDAYRAAAEEADIMIAEVGAWSNPLATDPTEAKRALETCKASLGLADRLHARCCVNIAGSASSFWCGPAADNFSDETYARIVATIQEIIDAVEPQHTYYTLEIMPWIAPDSADSYLALIEAINRDRFAVHLDVANLINTVQKYYANEELIISSVSKLKEHIKSAHAKDILIDIGMPPIRMTDEAPGDGNLAWATLLAELASLDGDVPLLLEHLETNDDYRRGANHLRAVAAAGGLTWSGPSITVAA